ncbi:PhnA domain-containing protein [Novipirellula sp. SH528]|uniref:PhnA domain-containing protein n=1 Tax=Novipirellula sp. SH528 TaxID=3454466 RepID=UPI003F9F41E2
MSVENELMERSGSKCELCGSSEGLVVHPVDSGNDNDAEKCVMSCSECHTQLDNAESVDANHWRCLNDSMWSQVPAVQVLAYRMLHQLRSEGWPQELLETLYLDEETKAWAEAGIVSNDDSEPPTLDSNGTQLSDGDNVTLIKDLVVKGAGFTAKRGTVVKSISLTSNPEHIEGRVNGTQIVLVANFLKKAN